MIAITVIFTVIASVLEAYFDAKKRAINHTISAIVRAIFAIAISYYMYWHPAYITLYAIILLLIYTIVFDPAYNFFKGVSLWYIGQTAVTDKFARKLVKGDGIGWLIIKAVILLWVCFAFDIMYLFIGV